MTPEAAGNKYIDYVGTWGPAICGSSSHARALCVLILLYI
jgi:glutamate-1-semialdehyde aminotransferase